MMFRTMLKSKIHRATVTEADVHYAGSITIDKDLMEAADILEHESVHVLDLSNGHRLQTYAISGERGSGRICMNGAAAHLVSRGNMVIILTYAVMDDERVATHAARVVQVNADNAIVAITEKTGAFDEC